MVHCVRVVPITNTSYIDNSDHVWTATAAMKNNEQPMGYDGQLAGQAAI